MPRRRTGKLEVRSHYLRTVTCKTGTTAALRLISQQFSPYLARAKMGPAGNATVRRLYGTAQSEGPAIAGAVGSIPACPTKVAPLQVVVARKM